MDDKAEITGERQWKGQRIDQLHVVVAVDQETGDEGVFAVDLGGEGTMPLLTSSRELRDQIEEKFIIQHEVLDVIEAEGQKLIWRVFTPQGDDETIEARDEQA